MRIIEKVELEAKACKGQITGKYLVLLIGIYYMLLLGRHGSDGFHHGLHPLLRFLLFVFPVKEPPIQEPVSGIDHPGETPKPRSRIFE